MKKLAKLAILLTFGIIGYLCCTKYFIGFPPDKIFVIGYRFEESGNFDKAMNCYKMSAKKGFTPARRMLPLKDGE